MSIPRRPYYARLNSEYSSLHIEANAPLQHNLDTKKLKNRCFLSIMAALVIAYILWLFDMPAGQAPKPQLKLVVIVHRHGARSSLNPYSFESEIDWEVDEGKLLQEGFQQGFHLGKHLREQYWTQLAPLFDISVQSISTHINRTVDTGNSVLFGRLIIETHSDCGSIGLLLDNQTEIGKGNCTCRPHHWAYASQKCVAQCIGINGKDSVPATVDISDEESDNDIMLRQSDFCKKGKEWIQRVHQSPEYKNASETMFQAEFEFAKKIVSNSSVCNQEHKCCHSLQVGDLYKMWSTVKCLMYHNGSTGPYRDLKKTSDILQKPAFWYWHRMFSSEIGPSVGGILLDQIIRDLEKGFKRRPRTNFRVEPVPNANDYSFILYSAHDSTLAGLLAAMKVDDWSIPHFASYIAFELYGPLEAVQSKTVEEDHYVRVRYDTRYLNIGNCGEDECSMKDFTKYLKNRRQTKIDCSRLNVENQSSC